jgi:hypothetical protein
MKKNIAKALIGFVAFGVCTISAYADNGQLVCHVKQSTVGGVAAEGSDIVINGNIPREGEGRASQYLFVDSSDLLVKLRIRGGSMTINRVDGTFNITPERSGMGSIASGVCESRAYKF